MISSDLVRSRLSSRCIGQVLIPDHPSNAFFRQFSNCIMYDLPLIRNELMPRPRDALACMCSPRRFGPSSFPHRYTDPKELVPLLREALSTEPQPLSPIEQVTDDH